MVVEFEGQHRTCMKTEIGLVAESEGRNCTCYTAAGCKVTCIMDMFIVSDVKSKRKQ